MWIKELKAWFVTFDWEQEMKAAIEACYDNPTYKVVQKWN